MSRLCSPLNLAEQLSPLLQLPRLPDRWGNVVFHTKIGKELKAAVRRHVQVIDTFPIQQLEQLLTKSPYWKCRAKACFNEVFGGQLTGVTNGTTARTGGLDARRVRRVQGRSKQAKRGIA